MMKNIDIPLLKTICETPGAPGFENQIRDFVIETIKPFVDEFSVDNMGNLVAIKRAVKGQISDKKVMVAAHLDEIGFNKYIEIGLNEQNGGNNVFVMKIGKNDVFPVTTDAVIGQLVGIEINSEMLKGKVYPNPFKDEFTIELEGAENTNATLLNNLGQEIASFNFQSAITYSTSFLTSGTYFLKIGNSVTKLVKLD